MHIVVTGATGNVGSALVRLLSQTPEVSSILGVARRRPDWELPKTRWAQADVQDAAALRTLFAGADAIVHLTFLIQPSRDRGLCRRVNVDGTGNVFDAAVAAGAERLVYASSVGAYSAGPSERLVDEAWPREGIRTSFYSADKADAEALLDERGREHPGLRVIRLRPGLVFGREAAAEIRRYFLGPFVPGGLLRPGLIPVLPDVRGVRFQAVHRTDLAQAFRAALLAPEAEGPYNVAHPQVLGLGTIAGLLRARTVPVPTTVARVAAGVTHKLRVQPTPPGWLDLAVGAPLMDAGRARDELGWTPQLSGEQAVGDLLDGLRAAAGFPTPPLAPHAGGPLRIKVLLSGLGARAGF